MNRFNLPDDVTLDMIDDHFASPPPDYVCAGCDCELSEEEAHEYDGDQYCDTCFIDKALSDHRYCTDCGVVSRECHTTSYNDEPYCIACLHKQITNLKRLGELWQQGFTRNLAQTAPVLFEIDGDSQARYVGIQEQLQANQILICLAPIEETDLALLGQSNTEQET